MEKLQWIRQRTEFIDGVLEGFLAEPATTETHDRIRQGVVVYMGSLARHIPPDDPKALLEAEIAKQYPQ